MRGDWWDRITCKEFLLPILVAGDSFGLAAGKKSKAFREMPHSFIVLLVVLDPGWVY